MVNVAVLVLRRDPGTSAHFRAPTVLPVLGAASCVLLATRIEGQVWLRGSAVLAVGALLGAMAATRRHRRRNEPDRADAHGGAGGAVRDEP
jgi:uncharacterized membrane protein YfcA